MCLFSHGYDGLIRDREWMVEGMLVGQIHGASRKMRCISRVGGDTMMTPDYTAVQVRRSR